MGRGIPVVVGALLGLAVGLAVGRVGSTRTSVPAEPLARSDPWLDPARPPPDADTRGAPEVGEAAIDRGAAAALAPLARGPLPPELRGDRRIEGTVRTESGPPLAGVRIRVSHAARLPVALSGDPPEAPAAPLDAAREAWERAARRAAEDRETGTDAEGRFQIAGLTEAPYKVVAVKEGWELRAADRRAWPTVRPNAQVDFVATRMVEVPIAVRFDDGTAPAEAAVRCDVKRGDQTWGSSVYWVATRPAIRLAPRTYALSATAVDDRGPGRPRPMRSAPVTVIVPESGAAPATTLELRPVLGIRGRLRIEGQETVGRVEVSLVRVGDGPPDPHALTTVPGRRLFGPGATRYEILDVEPGRYLIGADHRTLEGAVPIVHAVVEVRDGIVEHDLVLPPPDASAGLRVRVTGPDDEPVEDVEFDFEMQSPDGQGYLGSADATQLGRGEWVLALDEPIRQALCEGKPPGAAVTLLVTSGAYGARREAIAAGARAHAVRFGRLTVLTIEIAGLPEPLRRRLSFALNHPPSGPLPSGRSVRVLGGERSLDATGCATFDPIGGGDYQVQGTLETADGQGRFVVIRQPVSLAGGPVTERLAMPRLYRLEVTLPEDAKPDQGGRSLEIQQVTESGQWAGGGASAEADAGGRVVFPELIAGRYDLRRQGPTAAREMRITVEGDCRLAFRPAPLDTLEFTADPDEAEGLLPRAGLRSGDCIVGVEGDGFDGLTEFVARLEARGAVEYVALRVRSDAGERSVTVVPRALVQALAADAGLGGWLHERSR